jgi:HicB family
MDLTPYVQELHRQLDVAANAGGEEARAIAERLAAPLDAAARLMLLDALSAAAGEITTELAPSAVELRLRGGEPEFVMTSPPPDAPSEAAAPSAGAWAAGGADESATARINLRLPDRLKVRVEEAAAAAGLSVNSWLVRAIAAAVDGQPAGPAPAERRPLGGDRYTGWVT